MMITTCWILWMPCAFDGGGGGSDTGVEAVPREVGVVADAWVGPGLGLPNEHAAPRSA